MIETHTGTPVGSRKLSTHPDNINRDNGIEIPEAWIPTMKKHNRRAVRLTTEGTISNWTSPETTLHRNNEDWNALIEADQYDSYGDAQPVDLAALWILAVSSRNGAIFKWSWPHRETNDIHFTINKKLLDLIGLAMLGYIFVLPMVWQKWLGEE